MGCLLYAMKVEIENLVILNDRLENRNFVDLILTDENTNEEAVATISLDDLIAAVEAFDKQRKLDHERDKRYES